MRTKALTATKRVELVETHNLALSLARLQDGPYDTARWRRALYHAAGMSLSRGEAEKIRIALELP
jgi:hypothetical protein